MFLEIYYHMNVYNCLKLVGYILLQQLYFVAISLEASLKPQRLLRTYIKCSNELLTMWCKL